MEKRDERSITFSYVHIDPNRQIGMHQQSSWELSYIISGYGTRTIGSTTEPFTKGEVVLIPPGIPHCWHFDEVDTDEEGKITNITVTFYPLLLDTLSDSFKELDSIINIIKNHSDAIKFSAASSNSISAILRTMKEESDAERISSFIRLIITISESDEQRVVGSCQISATKEEQILDQVHTFVICNLRRKINIDDIARHVNMSRSSFCFFFKHAAGRSFISYLNSQRINYACNMLKKRNANISEICYLSGFNDIPYFNRVFKKSTGISPKQYRERQSMP